MRFHLMLSAVSGCSKDPACIQTAPLENSTWAGEKMREDRERLCLRMNPREGMEMDWRSAGHQAPRLGGSVGGKSLEERCL